MTRSYEEAAGGHGKLARNACNASVSNLDACIACVDVGCCQPQIQYKISIRGIYRAAFQAVLRKIYEK